jgi:hypothetical protein
MTGSPSQITDQGRVTGSTSNTAVQWVMDITGIVEAIDSEILRLQQARSLLTGHMAPLKRGLPRTAASSIGKGKSAAAGKRTISPEGRARIAAAQKARWAKVKRK